MLLYTLYPSKTKMFCICSSYLECRSNRFHSNRAKAVIRRKRY